MRRRRPISAAAAGLVAAESPVIPRGGTCSHCRRSLRDDEVVSYTYGAGGNATARCASCAAGKSRSGGQRRRNRAAARRMGGRELADLRRRGRELVQADLRKRAAELLHRDAVRTMVLGKRAVARSRRRRDVEAYVDKTGDVTAGF